MTKEAEARMTPADHVRREADRLYKEADKLYDDADTLTWAATYIDAVTQRCASVLCDQATDSGSPNTDTEPGDPLTL